MTAREDTILHRPPVELISEETLVGMERDGWTPVQVRELIASYRELNKAFFDALQREGERAAADVRKRTKRMVSRG